MDAQSIFGSVAIGKDTSGNFKQSIYGLAVRTQEGKYISLHKNELIDVTTLTLDGTENLIYRIPVKKPVAKDIIIRSDNPFSVLFVETVGNDGIVKGIDPATGEVQEYKPVTNLLGIHLFVTAAGPDNLMGKKESDEILPLLLLTNQGNTGNSSNALTTYMMSQSLGTGKAGDQSLLTLLLLSGQNGGANDALGLLLALRGKEFFEPNDRKGHYNKKEPRDRKELSNPKK